MSRRLPPLNALKAFEAAARNLSFTKAADELFVKVAAHIHRSGPLNVVGNEINNIKEITNLRPVVNKEQSQIIGSVIYIDNYGNVVTNITEKLFKEISKTREFTINARSIKFSKIHKNSFVIGCDQALVVKNIIFSKAKNSKDLKQQLLMLNGKSHKLYSSCVVLYQEEIVWSHTAEIVLLMRELSQREISTYVDKNWESVKNSVGGYLIESTGKRLFKTIHGDYFSTLGLPIIELLDFLISKKAVSVV